MNIALWIITWLLAAAFLASGLSKLALTKQKLAGMGMGWTNDFSSGGLKAIGVLEILAAIGLIVPALLGNAQVLVPLAAVGLVLLMGGAIIVHLRRHESKDMVSAVILFLLAAVVVVGRFGPQSFTS